MKSQKMIDEARMIWKSYNRPNIMVKIPATIEGTGYHTTIDQGWNQCQRYIDLYNFTISKSDRCILHGFGKTP